MVGTILPIGHGERQQGRFAISPWFHAFGAVGGAALLGSLLGALGAMLPLPILSTSRSVVMLVATGLVGLLYSLRELALAPVPAPQFQRQVPAKWRLLLRPQIAALLYGLGLGIGVATRITVTTFYIVAFWALLGGSPARGALTMAAFGLGRALPVVGLGRWLRTGAETLRFVQTANGWEAVVHLINGVVLGFASTYLLILGLSLH